MNAAKTRSSLFIRKLTYSALCLALAIVLPFLTRDRFRRSAQCSAPCTFRRFSADSSAGWQYGAVVGFVSPLLRMLMFGMPPVYVAIAMAFELAVYGAISGLLYRAFPKKVTSIYLSLLTAMIAGRLIWGAVKFVMAGIQHTEFSFALFLSGAVTTAIPGIILQIVLIPVLVMVAEKAKLVLE